VYSYSRLKQLCSMMHMIVQNGFNQQATSYPSLQIARKNPFEVLVCMLHVINATRLSDTVHGEAEARPDVPPCALQTQMPEIGPIVDPHRVSFLTSKVLGTGTPTFLPTSRKREAETASVASPLVRVEL